MKTTILSRTALAAITLALVTGCAVNTFVTNVKVDTKLENKTDARDVNVFKPSKEA